VNEASQFLTSVAQAIATMSLYKTGHPARERALDGAHERLQELQAVKPIAQFTFLGEEIVFDRRPLRDLKGWSWGTRFAGVGLQRLELSGPVERADLEVFLDEVYARMSGAPPNTAEARPGRPTNIRFGAVGLRGESGETVGEGRAARIATASMGYTLKEEVDAVDWLHGELKEGQELHLLEAESIVRSLSVAMHGDQAFVIPLLKLKRYDQYTTTHAMNVSVLAMALAEQIGLTPTEVRAFGISGLLHDLGKVMIPEEILNKPGKLSDAERAVMNRHPIDGARMILETERQLDLAATVAYEHHIKLNGGGYPSLTYPRRCHQASDMVHVCDVFDALRTNRPYREAWATDRVLSYLEEGAGTEFDPDLIRAFVQMMRTWEGKVMYVDRPEEPIPPPEGTGAPLAPAADAPAAAEAVPSPAHIESIEVTPVATAALPSSPADPDEIEIDDDQVASSEDIAALTEGAPDDDDMSWE
jgi:putative nucleotidyltransferase with HDIG domain